MNLALRRPDPRIPAGFGGGHEVFVIWQAAGVIEEISDGYGFTVGREIRKYLYERFVVAQLFVVDQQHDGHGGKLFGERCEAEVGGRVDFRVRSQIADTVSFSKRCASVLLD
jgi:hypothetical protein